MKIRDTAVAVLILGLMLGSLWTMKSALASWYGVHYGSGAIAAEPADAPLLEIETRLRPVAEPKQPPGPNDWLATHTEFGQTFRDYQNARPVGFDAGRKTIHIALIGDFSPEQLKILDQTREAMSLFFGVAVTVKKQISRASLPARATRIHPTWRTRQILTGYVLEELLKPGRPDDAMAYLAFTSDDLTPGEGWNFVFGQASLRDRTGVWSIHRFGDPARDRAAYQLCLRRTISVATHETGHIFTIQHCTAFECNMNGANHQEESDRAPLHYCPVCLRKLCWNLKLDPVAHLEALERFYRQVGFDDEVLWCRRAVVLLKKSEVR